MDIHRPAWLEQVEGVRETLNEGVIVSDGARILSVNSRFEELIGMPRAENCGKRSLPFLYP
jgi:PAS domain-containing protein